MGDGQTVLRLRDAKKKFPDAFKHVLIANGHFAVPLSAKQRHT